MVSVVAKTLFVTNWFLGSAHFVSLSIPTQPSSPPLPSTHTHTGHKLNSGNQRLWELKKKSSESNGPAPCSLTFFHFSNISHWIFLLRRSSVCLCFFVCLFGMWGNYTSIALSHCIIKQGHLPPSSTLTNNFLPVTQHILPSGTLPLDSGKQARFTASSSEAWFFSFNMVISWANPTGLL